MVLGVTIRRWHILLPILAGVTYGAFSYNAKVHEAKETFGVLKASFAQPQEELPNILKNYTPEEVYKVFSTRYGKDHDCYPYSEIIARCLHKDYSPKILHLESPDFIKKYPFECHNTCIFRDYGGQIGSIDNICGYIEPQDSIEDVVKVLSHKLGVKNITPSVSCPSNHDTKVLFEMLNESYYGSNKKGYL